MLIYCLLLCALLAVIPSGVQADDDAQRGEPSSTTQPAVEATGAADARPIHPLNKEQTVFLDAAGKRLILKTEVVLRAGLLEMLLCKAHTKEHESILAIDSDAFIIHGGLVALGAEVGSPVRYEPKFQPPQGQTIKINLRWSDAEGRKHEAPAQSWIRNSIHRYYSAPLSKLPEGFTLPEKSELRFDEQNGELIWYGPMTSAQRDDLLSLSQDAQYRKGIVTFYERSQSRPLEADWVFAGSGFWVQPDGERTYQAEEGNVICVANFGDAMLDLSVESTASNEGLQFEPWTDRIPEIGTEVEVELIPVFEESETKDAAEPDDDRKTKE